MGSQQKGETCRSINTDKLKKSKTPALRWSPQWRRLRCSQSKEDAPLHTYNATDQVALDDAGSLGPAAVRSISFFWRLPLPGRSSLLITSLRYCSSTSFASFRATARTCWQMEATFGNSIFVPSCRSFFICSLLFFQASQAHVCQSGRRESLITSPGRRDPFPNILQLLAKAIHWEGEPVRSNRASKLPDIATIVPPHAKLQLPASLGLQLLLQKLTTRKRSVKPRDMPLPIFILLGLQAQTKVWDPMGRKPDIQRIGFF